MAFRLSVVRGGREQRFLLPDGESLLGSAASCELQLAEPTVSRQHLRLRVADGEVWIEDLGSRNGVFVDGARLTSRQRIRPGVVLRLGGIELQLGEVDAADAEAVTQPVAAPATRPAKPAATLALSSLGSFCRDALPGLLACLARGDGQALAARLIDALCAQEGVAAAQLLSAEGALLAEGGGLDAVLWVESRDPQHVLRVGTHTVDVQPALRRMAEIGLDLLRLQVRDGGDRHVAKPREQAAAQPPDPPTRHAGLARIYQQAQRVAGGELNVLIEGESGTGKEVLARFLHECAGGTRLVCLNCAALPRDLLDAELFGIEAGVATGVSARPGCFERAHGGTLFLDEIADMAADTQARLLRVLQERRVYRIGGREARPAEVRVVSASNRRLHDLVQRGEFRLDLYHRIQDWCVELPPLRERREDVLNLAGYFLAQECRKRGIGSAGITRAAANALQAYEWPGNVRELEREMRRIALFLDDGDLVDSALLKPEIRGGRDSGERLADRLADAERRIIEATLQGCDGNVAHAAERLGLGKSTLYRRLGELGIARE